MAVTGISANRLELLQIANAVAQEKNIDREIVTCAADPDLDRGAARLRRLADTEERELERDRPHEHRVADHPRGPSASRSACWRRPGAGRPRIGGGRSDPAGDHGHEDPDHEGRRPETPGPGSRGGHGAARHRWTAAPVEENQTRCEHWLRGPEGIPVARNIRSRNSGDPSRGSGKARARHRPGREARRSVSARG